MLCASLLSQFQIMNKNENPENKQQAISSENESRQPLTGKVDLERGKATDCPEDGEGDRNDTKEMEDLNRDQ
jgi:hypothetical protein